MVETFLPIRLEKAVVRKGGRVILGPLSLTLEGSGCLAIIGPVGAGKSTLLKAVYGMERLSEGCLTRASQQREAEYEQAFVFQTPILLRRSVVGNVAYPLRLRGWSRAKSHQEALNWLSRVGLSDYAAKPAFILSGGQRQKMALVRALITRPRLLCMDEPTSSLDDYATSDIESLIRGAIEDGTKVILATHNLSQAKRLATQGLFLLQGKIEAYGARDCFFDHPEVASLSRFLKGELIV